MVKEVKGEKPLEKRKRGVKAEKPILLKIFSVILITLVTESIAIFYASNKGYPIPKGMLLLQVPLILFMLGFAYVKNRRIWQRKVEEYGVNLKEISRHSKTDLDALYTILKNKKEISVRSISNLFKIPEDLAMEWSRILEAGDLATIEYPGFGSPKVMYIEKEKKVTLIKGLNKKDKKVLKKAEDKIHPNKKIKVNKIRPKRVVTKKEAIKITQKKKLIKKNINKQKKK